MTVKYHFGFYYTQFLDFYSCEWREFWQTLCVCVWVLFWICCNIIANGCWLLSLIYSSDFSWKPYVNRKMRPCDTFFFGHHTLQLSLYQSVFLYNNNQAISRWLWVLAIATKTLSALCHCVELIVSRDDHLITWVGGGRGLNVCCLA